MRLYDGIDSGGGPNLEGSIIPEPSIRLLFGGIRVIFYSHFTLIIVPLYEMVWQNSKGLEIIVNQFYIQIDFISVPSFSGTYCFHQ